MKSTNSRITGIAVKRFAKNAAAVVNDVTNMARAAERKVRLSTEASSSSLADISAGESTERRQHRQLRAESMPWPGAHSRSNESLKTYRSSTPMPSSRYLGWAGGVIMPVMRLCRQKGKEEAQSRRTHIIRHR